jgi:hypothetical protein
MISGAYIFVLGVKFCNLAQKYSTNEKNQKIVIFRDFFYHFLN